MSAFVDAEGKVTKHVRSGVMLQLQWAGGVIMKWRWVWLLLVDRR